MKTSIKLLEPFFFDSTGIVHNKKILSNILNDLLSEIKIIDFNKNSNGYYIKFSNGLLICFNKINYKKTNYTTWGNIYSQGSVALGDFAHEFKEEPYMIWSLTKTPNYNTGTQWGAAYGNITNKNAGSVEIFRGQGSTNVTGSVHYIAIGFWK